MDRIWYSGLQYISNHVEIYFNFQLFLIMNNVGQVFGILISPSNKPVWTFKYFQYTFEKLFRSQHYTLMDNCCREYLFIVDFFMVSSSGTPAQDLFNNIMGKTLSMFLVSKYYVYVILELYMKISSCSLKQLLVLRIV